jgi:L-lysine 2,3-aminomutase
MLHASNETTLPEIPLATPTGGGEAWRQALREAVRDPHELAALLELPRDVVAARLDHAPDFPLLVPRSFIARMRKGDPDDPLLAQVLPRVEERAETAGFTRDPLAERHFCESGLVRKYRQRALLITTGACPVHCRYCFRRHFPYSSELAARNDWQPALEALEHDRDTLEVILSGGDPLSLSTARLTALVERLEQREHIRYLRIHTRYPVMIPERVDVQLLALFARTRLRTIVVIHTNHPAELNDARVRDALANLAGATHALLNQSVLLRGINDSASVLIELSRELFECRVLPYYLHLLDRVAGAAHFEVDEAQARALIATVRASLPGFLVPRLVREQPGELSKTVVS